MPSDVPVPHFDLYLELEVHPTASTPTIEGAFRSLLRRHHPDLWGEGETGRMQRLNTARDWLTDPSLRERYDRERLGFWPRGDIRPEVRRPRSPSYAGKDPSILHATSRQDEIPRWVGAIPWVIAIGTLGLTLLVGSISIGIGTSVATIAAFALGLMGTVYAVSMALFR